MPELPEVETTRRGLAPLISGTTLTGISVRETRLRWPFEQAWTPLLTGQMILSVERRAKYLIIRLTQGTLLVHLGMSGNLRCVSPDTPLKPHDHLEFVLDNGLNLRYHDPRRFGCVIYLPPGTRPDTHPLLAHLGLEPLSPEFSGQHLFERSRGRKTAVKTFLMDQQNVVGVGNIYASEALYGAGIRPDRPAGRISLARYERLANEVRKTLQRAIEQGGTTLRDFVGGDGQPGYFQQTLQVYGRGGEPCLHCGAPIHQATIGQRSSFFCTACQR